MTSSHHEYSDDSEADEQQNESETQAQSASANGISHSSVSAPNAPHVMPPQVGQGHPMVQGPYPYPDPYYRSIFAPYDAQPYPAPPMIHMQLLGIQQAGVPLPSDSFEEPVFVNAKQYNGIMRRRQSRAKAESEKKLLKSRKQPYLHESRHLHALRRARGCGGRFLNAKKDEDQQNEETAVEKNSHSMINLNIDKNDHASSDSTA